jgi:hypothetical protein
MTLSIKNSAFAFLALLLGSFGFYLAFYDLGSGESWLERAVLAALFFFLSGFGLGFFNPGGWTIAGLTTWGCVLMGGLILFAAISPRETIGVIPPPDISAGLILLFIPATLALVGGYTGKMINRRRNA